MRQRKTNNVSFVCRRGLATLELALALPVLAILAAVLFATAQSGIARLEATLHARQKAWRQRDKASSRGIAAIRPNTEDLVEGRSTQPIKGPPILHALLPQSAKAQHAVLASSLDYRSIPLNDPPELKFAQDLARSIVPTDGNSLTGLSAGLDDIPSALGGQLNGMLAQSAASQQRITDAKNQLANAQKQLAQQRSKLQDEIRQAEQRVQGLSRAVDQSKKQLADLEDQRKKAENIKDKTKRKQALDAIDRQERAAKKEQDSDAKQLDSAKAELLRLRFAELADQHLAP